MKVIKVNRDFTNLWEVLYENNEINSYNQLQEYLNNNIVKSNNYHPGETLREGSIKFNVRLMKDDVILIEPK